jgi:hypothetical protein
MYGVLMYKYPHTPSYGVLRTVSIDGSANQLDVNPRAFVDGCNRSG